MHKRNSILGIKFDNLSLDECVPIIERYIEEKKFHFIVTPDMFRIVKALKDAHIKHIYQNADLTLSDGTAMVLASRILRTPLKERVPCTDLADKILELVSQKGYSIFIFRGGEDSHTKNTVENIRQKYPRINITGTFSVPYDFDPSNTVLNNQLLAAILEKKPHILLFSLGYRKEEEWIWQNKNLLNNIPVCLGIGGTMDIYAGKVKLAPQFMRDIGLEWLFRIMQEPKRLSKRYIVSGLFFFYFVFEQILKNIFCIFLPNLKYRMVPETVTSNIEQARPFIHKLSSRFRRRRFIFFKLLIASLPRPMRILDVGGTQRFWQDLGVFRDKDMEIWLLNSRKEEADHSYFKFIIGDARDMSGFIDKEFDVVFSNSLIEHLGGYDEQRRMANEVRRVGKRYFIQTSYRYFPIEPHPLFPYFQFFPKIIKIWLMTNFDLGWHGKFTDKNLARKEIESIRLLNRRDLEGLFPDGKIIKEKFFGLTKSLIVYKM